MKESKVPADPNRRATATVDAIEANLDLWPEAVQQEKTRNGLRAGSAAVPKAGGVSA